jgi:hypothetical protein
LTQIHGNYLCNKIARNGADLNKVFKVKIAAPQQKSLKLALPPVCARCLNAIYR